ncbi:hypothetical protein MMC08_005236 [Hypocenomyce scalaris]|nr:hypothetical protein [Hypocenomyce scalaris]
MEGKKRISCQRCQIRKIKCTRVYPCCNCTLVRQECTFRGDDSKRRPVGRSYVVALESQVAKYESILRKAKAASGEERSALLDSISSDEYLSSPQENSINREPNIDTEVSSRMATMSLQPSLQGSLLFYGPTSMYQRDISLDKPQDANYTDPRLDLEWQTLRLSQNLRIEDSVINKALSLFFLYQYPQFMFIYREAFLEDYYENTHRGKYWSYPLLYAICALGVRASPDEKALGRPHVTVAQSLLCLAFYELGKGNHSKGWLLAGMAFRIGQELGLQQDPKFLISQDSSIASDQDLVIRRRVYWGLYVSDKIISLYLGRPAMLYEAEAAVDLPQPLPDFSEEHNWFGLSALTESVLGHISGTILMPAFEGLIELSKITEEILLKVFSTKMVKKPQRDLILCRSSRLEELSVQLGLWHSSLPVHLSWNQWNPGDLKPHVLIVHLFYHSILVSLNRHFIRPTSGFPAKAASKDTCIASADSIIALIRQFRTQQGLGNSPALVVYSAVMAGSGILFTQDFSILAEEKDQRLSFILKALEECSPTHKLAREAQIKLQANIDARRSLATELKVAGETTQPSKEHYPESVDMPSMSWVDGSMFDLGAFDLGTFGSLDPIAFEGIGADPSQGLAAFTTNPDMIQSWMFNESSMDFQFASG